MISGIGPVRTTLTVRCQRRESAITVGLSDAGVAQSAAAAPSPTPPPITPLPKSQGPAGTAVTTTLRR